MRYTAGDGIITMPKQYTKDLHPSLEDEENPNNLIYGVSMFHQLHCLVIQPQPPFKPILANV
jgi:hypothetical protein